ncbi:CotH kinase family protein [Bacteroidota bacterium]
MGLKFSKLLVVLLLFSRVYSQTIDSISIICPNEVGVGRDIPIALLFYNDGVINNHITASYIIESDNSIIGDSIIMVKKGVGTLTTRINTPGITELKIQNTSFGKFINVVDEIQINNLEGELNDNTILLENSNYRITNDLIIPENVILSIPKGVTFLIDPEVNIVVYGEIQINGELNTPIVFGSYYPNQAWGGIRLINNPDTLFMKYGFFINGGGNNNYVFGHSDSQPVIKMENSIIELNNCYFFDNVGKALGSQSSRIFISDCIISRCDTGGEFGNSYLNINKSYIIDIPNNDSIYLDDDNDGFYFSNVHPSGDPSIVENSFFISGKDDAIDHNAAKLEIKNCCIENFMHEGIACSNANWVNVFNTLIMNCGQGIESGYGTPVVTVDHCVLLDNEVGFRFGDGYDWGCNGSLTITNSITYNNIDNIMNFDILSGGPVENGIMISYSITNDEDYNNYLGCFPGIPLFDENYQLLDESPGFGCANDNTNIGLFDSDNPESSIKEYYISCNPEDFDYLYQNYEQDYYIPITITHKGVSLSQARMRIRGSGTRSLPKKSLKIQLDGNLNSDSVKVYNFNAEYEDKSYIQQYILSSLMKESGQYCFNAEYVRLYLNTEYLGLYLSVENIDEDFLINREIDPNGNLYKATMDGASMSIYDNIYYHWEKKTGTDNRDDLQEIIDGINTVSSDDYYQFSQLYFDYDKMINIIAVNLLTRNYSTYYHNYYLFHDINNSDKWFMLPWDLDKAFLYYEHNTLYHHTSKYWAPDNPFLERAILCDTIFDDIKTRIDELYNTIINDEVVSPIIDSLSNLIYNSVLEDKTDNIETIEEWYEKIEESRGAFNVRYNSLQNQFNNLPKSFKLERTKNRYNYSEDILFKWSPTSDPNGNEILYTLFYGKNINLDDGTANVIASIRDTSYLITENLDEGKYYWKVIVRDGNYSIEGYDNYNIFYISNSLNNVVINEINYNSHVDFDTGDWIELYNNSDESINISDWKFQDDDDSHIYMFPAGTILGPRAYLVLCNELPTFQNFYPEITNCLGDFIFGLNGSGELIRLFDNTGLLIDSLVYDDEPPWPEEADGTGYVLELIDPDFDNSIASSWISSTLHGSPGKPNPSINSIQDKNTHHAQLFQNFPNPFNLTTNIRYSLTKGSRIELIFYNIMGEIIHEFKPGFMLSGEYNYFWNTSEFSSGIYYYSLKVDGVIFQTNKAIKM